MSHTNQNSPRRRRRTSKFNLVQVLATIDQYQGQERRPPTYKEIASAVGARVPSTVRNILERLNAAGYIGVRWQDRKQKIRFSVWLTDLGLRSVEAGELLPRSSAERESGK